VYLNCEHILATAVESLSDSSGPEQCTRAIEELSEVLEGKGLGPGIVGLGLRHDCLCTRAAGGQTGPVPDLRSYVESETYLGGEGNANCR
jgi:hypothetical protein